jgi:hypothetical protein
MSEKTLGKVDLASKTMKSKTEMPMDVERAFAKLDRVRAAWRELQRARGKFLREARRG